MKFSTQEEYGLRCLLTVARNGACTIPEISRREGLTEPHVAKLLALLRKGDFIASTRGQSGGYTMARDPETITVAEVVACLGGPLYDEGFCARHSNNGPCARGAGCSIRNLWDQVQQAVDGVLNGVTIADIVRGEEEEERLQLAAAVPSGVRGRPTNADE